MSHYRTRTQLETQVRLNLDEVIASFWTAADLQSRIDRAMHRVWTEVRKLKDDYFDIQRLSTDGSLTILGETYAASSFAIAAGTRNYTLPPDLFEMRLIEVITSGYETVRFIYKKLNHPEHRALREITTNITPSMFVFDILTANANPTMVIAPLSDTALDLRLTYTRVLPNLAADGTAMEMPHALYMAVEAYATASALLKDRAAEAAVWEATGNTLIASMFGAHARQTQDPVFVESFMESFTGW